MESPYAQDVLWLELVISYGIILVLLLLLGWLMVMDSYKRPKH